MESPEAAKPWGILFNEQVVENRTYSSVNGGSSSASKALSRQVP